MKRTTLLMLALLVAPAAAQAQGAPVADGLRLYLRQFKGNLTAAVDDFPVAKLPYKPTPVSQSVATIVEHLSGSNFVLCSSVSGVPAPTDAAIPTPDMASPEELKARFARSWAFCDQVVGKMTDAGLADSVPFFGTAKRTRAAVILALPYDWADHYSQLANYLRLNVISPPNARVRAVPLQ